MLQQSLAFDEWRPPALVVGQSLEERWAEVKRLNPWIVPTFLRMARDAVGRGYERVGVKHLAEVYRWERSGRVMGDRWKWNNSWTALLARDLIEADPALADVIETRSRRSRPAGP